MTKKITAIVMSLVMLLACAIPAFAVTVLTKNEAAINAAKAEYIYSVEDASTKDEVYANFKVTKDVLNDDDAENPFYEVTVRSGYNWKYTCKVSYVGVAGVGTYVAEDGVLTQTNTIIGLLGTIIDQVITTIMGLLK